MPEVVKNSGTTVNKRIVSDRYNLEEGFTSKYIGAFSATNIYATVQLPHVKTPFSIGSLAALSISTHRDSFPVTNMYNVDPRGFTQGHRVTAGTLIFHTIDKNAFYFNQRSPNRLRERETVNGPNHVGLPHPDTLPLFDIHINYINEEGMLSFEALYGVRLLDFGKTLSFENLHPMESYSFMAIEYAPMRVVVPEHPVDPENKFLLNRTPTRTPIPNKIFGPPQPKDDLVDPDISSLDRYTA